MILLTDFPSPTTLCFHSPSLFVHTLAPQHRRSASLPDPTAAKGNAVRACQPLRLETLLMVLHWPRNSVAWRGYIASLQKVLSLGPESQVPYGCGQKPGRVTHSSRPLLPTLLGLPGSGPLSLPRTGPGESSRCWCLELCLASPSDSNAACRRQLALDVASQRAVASAVSTFWKAHF